MSKYKVTIHCDDGNIEYRVNLVRAIWEVRMAIKADLDVTICRL